MECIRYNEVYCKRLKIFLNTMYDVMGYSFPPGQREEDLQTVYHKCIQSGGDFLILINGQEVVGSVGLKVTDVEQGIGEVKRLFILPGFQGNGYGKVLLSELINISKDKGLRYLRLCTTHKSSKAIKLYEKLGFYYIHAYKSNPVTEIYMELKISVYS
jgi:putative acetyltransferase